MQAAYNVVKEHKFCDISDNLLPLKSQNISPDRIFFSLLKCHPFVQVIYIIQPSVSIYLLSFLDGKFLLLLIRNHLGKMLIIPQFTPLTCRLLINLHLLLHNLLLQRHFPLILRHIKSHLFLLKSSRYFFSTTVRYLILIGE